MMPCTVATLVMGPHTVRAGFMYRMGRIAPSRTELVFEEKRDSHMTYKEKLQQANREALAAVIGLAATIVVWALLGFGVAQTGIIVFSTPLWIITGCFGTFVFAVVLSIVMAKFVMHDVGLEDDEGEGADNGR